jgi:hypothetical protein
VHKLAKFDLLSRGRFSSTRNRTTLRPRQTVCKMLRMLVGGIETDMDNSFPFFSLFGFFVIIIPYFRL